MKLSLSEELQNNREEILKDEILKSVRTPWYISLRDGVFAGLVTTLLLTLVSIAIWLYDQKESDSGYQGPVEELKEKVIS